MHRLRRAPLVAACVGFVALLAAPAANAASVNPVFTPGNPPCPQGYTSIHKFEGNDLKNTTVNGITLTNVNVGAGSFDWSSTVAVDLVIVKGGPNANLYFYAYDTFGDTNLVTPANGGGRFGLSHVEFCTDGLPEQPPPQPAPGIDLVKAASFTAAPAGTPVTYTFTVKNTGNVVFSPGQVTLTDDKCDAGTLVPVTTDDALSPGETWTYRCTATIPAGTTGSFVNVAVVCVPSGNPAPNDKLCDSDTTTVTVTPPGTPPTPTPPGTTPPGTTPTPPTTGGGGVLPEEAVSGRARLRGPSGCVKQAFTARVSGREIASVAFFVDGKLVKRITGERSVYSVKIRPNAFGFGRHRVVARVTFSAESGTAARRLPLTFRRCAQGAVAPRFTG